MGYRVLLIAVKGKDPAVICEEYSVAPTNRYEEIPDLPVNGAMLPSGAYLLYINDQILPDEQMFATLSRDAFLIACYANETTMTSYVCAWENGFARWSVFHDAQQGPDHLETMGVVPDQLSEIRATLSAKQHQCRDADYIFDVPIELFVRLGGIRYDQDIVGAGLEPWQVLARTAP